MIAKSTSSNENEEYNVFGAKNSNRTYALLLLYRTLDVSNTLILVQMALQKGAIGYIIAIVLSNILICIPVTYMELLISQFTGRDCIDMWKIRPCLSHIGYLVQFWQVITFLYNHVIVSILLHYLIISFDSPPIYTKCGSWAKDNCDLAKNNYTAYYRCVRSHDATENCGDFFHTYPEYQYFQYNLFGGKKHTFQISWTIIITSAVALLFVYLNTFRRINSLKWFLIPMIAYPLIGYLVLLVGSMRQQGVVSLYPIALDLEFEDFSTRFQATALVLQTLYNVGAGSGVMLNIGSLGSFRSPCYSNSVLAVSISTIFTVIAIATSAMMSCSYGFEYGKNVDLILDHPTSFAFVIMPRMINEYESSAFWHILAYSCSCVLGVNTNIAIFFSFFEVFARRFPKIGRYSELFCFIAVVTIFFLTMPVLGTYGRDIIGVFFRKCIFSVSYFMVTLESIVFLLWYGFNKFYEDIHFMQGVQPNNFMKVMWIISPFVLMYVYIRDLYIILTGPMPGSLDYVGLAIMLVMILLVLLILIGKLIVAAFQRKFLHQLKLDPRWGPRSEVLRRSRAMFTAHAMTKEYMYRQYHLQAGVIARQKVSNTRRNTDV